MSASTPLVSVLMPVYNAAPYIAEAVRSILEQTFTDFELLIFNDGSTDASGDIIRSIKDDRIILFDNKVNSGYVAHLNEGLRIAKGVYIARMDADDIALPERFAKQVALLNDEPTIGLCGTRYQMFGARDEVVHLPVEDKQLRAFMLIYSPMGHPTVMFRKSVVERYGLTYDESFMPAEDYKLWYDFSKVSKLRNLPDVLLQYRVHPHQISSYQSEKQRVHSATVQMMQLRDKGFNLALEEQKLYSRIVDQCGYLDTAKDFDAVLNLMLKIILMNRRLQVYDENVFIGIFNTAWRRFVDRITNFTPAHIYPILLRKKLVTQHMSLFCRFKFLLKAALLWKV